MDTEISHKIVDEADFDKLINLGKTYYPANHPALTDSFLKWLYLNNPDGRATLVIAQETELWIGMMVLIPITLEHSSGLLQKACYAINVLTHPDHRTKNLFVKMISHTKTFLQEQNIWLLGHPNANAIPGWKRQKMQFREPLQLYINKLSFFIGVHKESIKNLEQLSNIPKEFWTQLAQRQDAHVKYTPEFIAWRYLEAPHKQYRVFSVYKNKQLLGLYITRNFKFCIDLTIDFISPSVSNYAVLLSSVFKPTLLMFPSLNNAQPEILKACWKLLVKRQFPFFVTTWIKEDTFDMSGITLAASDF
jgi:hypothetical protein